ncbi:tetratricopeptide repeat protein [Thalassobius sp. Cn5-15]|jgi:tetratricopeptide (TPR) repeat protein|uniref:tetratricopeptide repeat protein n=1 Tax=Thalassobius sp. Cn5-15 TaxID=2917763 RepID=UPI001EF28351|nr:tetratricopeptide repeat protein [Thalassobius sp. Cn5-15]MCG7494303.1 hypothetical protein [Thalassobius sp. Cn5-15]
MKRVLSPSATLLIAILSGPLHAADCPPAVDHGDQIAALLNQARIAPDARSGQLISNEMWAIWAKAPDEVAQAILDRGMAKRASFDYVGAKADFDALVAYCPDYAEGYNQRAFVLFLTQEYTAALADLDHALERSPTHVAALAGKALTLMALNKLEEGQALLRQALALNPWLPERGMLLPEDALRSDTDL